MTLDAGGIEELDAGTTMPSDAGRDAGVVDAGPPSIYRYDAGPQGNGLVNIGPN